MEQQTVLEQERCLVGIEGPQDGLLHTPPLKLASRTISCGRMAKLIVLQAIGGVSDALASRVTDHLKSCPKCRDKALALAVASEIVGLELDSSEGLD